IMCFRCETGTRRCVWGCRIHRTGMWLSGLRLPPYEMDLLEGPRNSIAKPNRAASHHRAIHADVGFVVLCGGAENPQVGRQIPLGEGGHHTSRARPGDVNTDSIADRERAADPTVFDEARAPGRGIDHDVGSKAAKIEIPARIELTESEQCHAGQ